MTEEEFENLQEEVKKALHLPKESEEKAKELGVYKHLEDEVEKMKKSGVYPEDPKHEYNMRVENDWVAKDIPLEYGGISKYYTPSIEDIRVGYECEVKSVMPDDKGEEIWDKQIIDFLDNKWIKAGISEPYIRVPYLTREQIEAEGWRFKIEYTGSYRLTFEKGNNWLSYNPEIHMASIIPIDPSLESYEHHAKYAGKCRCINDLRLIEKLLTIS